MNVLKFLVLQYICIAARWTPKLEMYRNIKTIIRPADNRTDRRMEKLYCHSGGLIPWPAAICAAHNYEQGIDKQKVTRATGRRDIKSQLDPSGVHWAPFWGINASRCWTPTLEIKSNTKMAKGPWTIRWVDRRK